MIGIVSTLISAIVTVIGNATLRGIILAIGITTHDHRDHSSYRRKQKDSSTDDETEHQQVKVRHKQRSKR